MIRIAYISPSFYPAIKYGGPIYSTLNTCQELANLGLDIYVSTTNTNVDCRLDVKTGKFSEFRPNFHIKYYNETIIGKVSFPLLFNLWSDITKANIIHIQAIFNSPTPIALGYAKFFRKHVVLTPRGTLSLWGLKNKKSLWKKIWLTIFIKPFANSIIWHATSKMEKEEIQFLFPKAKITVIPNGIHLEKSNNTITNKLKFLKNKAINSTITENCHVIVSMGRIHQKKGFDILIKSFNRILLKHPEAFLLIAGHDEGELSSLKNLVDDLKLKDRCFFVGNIEGQDKIDFFSIADVFVLPSFTENFGNVYAEALAAGTPIVASTNTPWHEVEEAGCGRWVPNTVNDTTGAILDILQRDRETMRQNALKYVQKYEWKNIALEFKNLYESLV